MDIGFTGTREGMTTAQNSAVCEIVLRLPENLVLHHGDCIGADYEMHDLVEMLKPKARFHGHPPIISTARAWCPFDVIEPPKDYLERNLDIVRASELVIATPKEFTDQPRGSGTWATIRRSREWGKRLIIVFPDGSVEKERT